MSYTALYRRLRPKKFMDVFGQRHIVQTLANQISSGRIHHAYLLCGTRGTGKTSTARLFARACNCKNPHVGEPCNVCESCAAIIAQRSLDVVEIDAASNNSVDNVRDLREEVRYPPELGKYKVYIIDEVHMLSTGAFNALLKTLEEPPAHVVFILATTDPQKIPPTILSRCQRFDFKRISANDIFSAIKGYISAGELDTRINDDALMYISVLADGSMRDALGILEQCTVFYSEHPVALEDVRDIVGAADNTVFFELTHALNNFDTDKCLNIIADLVYNGRNIQQFVSDLIVHFRNLLVVGADSSAVDLSFENSAKLKEQSKEIHRDVLLYLINIFSLILSQLRYSANERIILETTCIRFCNPIPEAGTENLHIEHGSYLKALEQRVDELERRLNLNSTAAIKETETFINKQLQESVLPTQKLKTDIKDDQNKKILSPASKPVPFEIVTGWKEFIAGFEMPLRAFLMKAEPAIDANGQLKLLADAGRVATLKLHEAVIKKKLKDKFGSDIDFEITDKKPNADQPRKFDSADFTEKINIDIMFEN